MIRPFLPAMTPDDDAVFDMNDCPFSSKDSFTRCCSGLFAEFTPTLAKHTSDAVKITDHHLNCLYWERVTIDFNEANS
jgi:hypothetical protein